MKLKWDTDELRRRKESHEQDSTDKSKGMRMNFLESHQFGDYSNSWYLRESFEWWDRDKGIVASW